LHVLSELRSETSLQASQVPLSLQKCATSRESSSQSAWLKQQPCGLDGHWAMQERRVAAVVPDGAVRLPRARLRRRAGCEQQQQQA
jgi:hypothetical protein